MKTNVIVQTAALVNGNANRSLSEGSSVYVRVIKNNGNNSFTVAFAGGRYNIKSELPLKPGTGFLTTVKFDAGKIILVQKDIKLQLSAINLQKINTALDASGNITNPALINYFNRLGIAPDGISLSIYNQMKELQARFDWRVFNKVRNIAEKFKGREKTAASIAYILEQKGISSSYDLVEEYLEESDFLNTPETNPVFYESEEENPFCKFFKEIFEGRNYENNPAGLQTVFNHLGFSCRSPVKTGNWIRIPFEFSYENKGKKNGNGSFSALIDNISKKAEKFHLVFDFQSSRFDFHVITYGGKVMKIILNGNGNNEAVPFIAKELSGKFVGAEIEINESDSFSDFYAENLEIKTFNGVI